MTRQAYYMLYARSEGASWGPQFGDHDRADVEHEARDWVRSLRDHNAISATLKGHTHIVRTDRIPTGAECKACADQLNASEA